MTFQKKINEIVKGINLDKYIDDPDPVVRMSLVNFAGYGCDKLYCDLDKRVRRAVAKHGDHLDFLINDPNPEVRAEVAKHGYNLDHFIDKRGGDVFIVAREIIEQGYRVEKFIDDIDERTASLARKKLQEMNKMAI